jgi:hypothetical protein
MKYERNTSTSPITAAKTPLLAAATLALSPPETIQRSPPHKSEKREIMIASTSASVTSVEI